MKNVLIALVFLSTSVAASAAERTYRGLTKDDVLSIGSNSGNVCATVHARSDGVDDGVITGTFRSRIQREACFNSARQCQNWFYAAQSHYRDVKIRRACG